MTEQQYLKERKKQVDELREAVLEQELSARSWVAMKEKMDATIAINAMQDKYDAIVASNKEKQIKQHEENLKAMQEAAEKAAKEDSEKKPSKVVSLNG